MNDLERDLQSLFEQRARDVDPAGLAPDTIIRRGHRRQARTILGGVLAGMVAIAVAFAAIGSLERPSSVVPGGPQPLPERTTTIGGVPVTAPAGWTLINDWPLAAVMATSSQTCTFTATGEAIDGNGSPTQESPQPESTQSCSSEPMNLPAGVPVLQLANFEIPLLQTVCGLGDSEAPVDLPADGVAVYVADMSGSVTTDDLLAACPGSENVHDRQVMTTFADDQLHTVFAAVLVAGPNASQDDIGTAGAYLDRLGGIRIAATGSPSTRGPGYVMAAGANGEESWRLEAGITSFSEEDGTPNLGAALVTTTPSDEGSRTLAPATRAEQITDDYSEVGNGVVQFGTATSDVASIDIVGADGQTMPATMMTWPRSLGLFPDLVVPSPTGRLWYAEGAEPGDVVPTVADTASLAPTPSAPSAGTLQTRTTSDDQLVVYGHDLGHDWEIRHHNGEIQFYLDGANAPAEYFSFSSGASTSIDVDGGSFLLGVFDPSVRSWAVTVDETGTTPKDTINGRYAPAQDATGRPANLWLIALPGSGTGTASGVSTLPDFVSWPANRYPDGLFGAGSDGVVSWGVVHHNDQCALVKVIGADPSDSGTSECLPSWHELDRNGDATPLIGGVYGQKNATVAIVLPSGTPVNVAGGTLDCIDVTIESNFSGTEFCVFSLGNAESVHVAFGEHWNALGGPITLAARPGALDVSDAAPTSSP